jgi:hypothetical protein
MAFIRQNANLPQQFFLPFQKPLLAFAVTQAH